MQFLNVLPRHERRIRLLFDKSCAIGAFTDLSHYTVTNTDGTGASPNVVKVYAVSGTIQAVELQLDSDLVGGSRYTVSAVGVPATDLSVTPNPSDLPFYFGQSPVFKSSGQDGVSDLDAALYGIDILYHGADFIEAPDGDLAVVSGTSNLQEAMWRRALSEGLPWAPDYGLHGREFVDATPGSLGTLQARAITQMKRDDRVKNVQTKLSTDGPQAFLSIFIDPIGVGEVEALQVPLNNINLPA